MAQWNAFHRFIILFASPLSLLVLSGCGGSGLTTVPIEIDPQAAAQLAMDAYDTNGDGKFDKSTIFADKLTEPTGVLWHRGALYVAASPSLWRLVDTDGDGVADERTDLLKGQNFIR